MTSFPLPAKKLVRFSSAVCTPKQQWSVCRYLAEEPWLAETDRPLFLGYAAKLYLPADVAQRFRIERIEVDRWDVAYQSEGWRLTRDHVTLPLKSGVQPHAAKRRISGHSDMCEYEMLLRFRPVFAYQPIYITMTNVSDETWRFESSLLILPELPQNRSTRLQHRILELEQKVVRNQESEKDTMARLRQSQDLLREVSEENTRLRDALNARVLRRDAMQPAQVPRHTTELERLRDGRPVLESVHDFKKEGT